MYRDYDNIPTKQQSQGEDSTYRKSRQPETSIYIMRVGSYLLKDVPAEGEAMKLTLAHIYEDPSIQEQRESIFFYGPLTWKEWVEMTEEDNLLERLLSGTIPRYRVVESPPGGEYSLEEIEEE